MCVFQCVSSGTVKARLSNLEKWKSDFLLVHTRTAAKHSVRAFVSWWIAAMTRHNYTLYKGDCSDMLSSFASPDEKALKGAWV